MRRCGVCFVAVHGRVEAAGRRRFGVLNDGRRLRQSCSLDSWVDAWDWSSLASAIPACRCVCSTAFGVCDPCPSNGCLFATSNCRNPEASLLYLASSAPRLGPETCTRISNGGVMVSFHLGKKFLVQVSKLCSLIYVHGINQCCASSHLQ